MNFDKCDFLLKQMYRLESEDWIYFTLDLVYEIFFSFLYLFSLVAIPSGSLGLFLPLHLSITPGSAQRNTGGAGHWTQSDTCKTRVLPLYYSYDPLNHLLQGSSRFLYFEGELKRILYSSDNLFTYISIKWRVYKDCET